MKTAYYLRVFSPTQFTYENSKQTSTTGVRFCMIVVSTIANLIVFFQRVKSWVNTKDTGFKQFQCTTDKKCTCHYALVLAKNRTGGTVRSIGDDMSTTEMKKRAHEAGSNCVLIAHYKI